jgi:hypothetical protein
MMSMTNRQLSMWSLSSDNILVDELAKRLKESDELLETICKEEGD